MKIAKWTVLRVAIQLVKFNSGRFGPVTFRNRGKEKTPYICDQLAMSRLPRASFALLLALLPATATVVGAVVLAQIPTLHDLIGVALVMAGVALHKPASTL